MCSNGCHPVRSPPLRGALDSSISVPRNRLPSPTRCCASMWCQGHEEPAPMIISRTPFRLSLFGGGTDYPDWFREHGGAVVGTTIDKYCYISVRRLPPFFEHRSRIVYSQVELVREISEIQHLAVRGILSEMGISDG